MNSRWAHLKSQAIAVRKRGASIRDVEKQLGIPRSTLSGWFRNVELSEKKKELLKKKWAGALIVARKKAVIWHNTKKAERIAQASFAATETLRKLDLTRNEVVELALAFLYLGEGAKKAISTSMGNSDPFILKFFVSGLQKVYQVPLVDIKCELHLRADQNSKILKKYWSKALGIPLVNFGASVVDVRTKGTTTYPHYKGVCVVRCSRVAIQRKLLYIAKGFCEEVANADARVAQLVRAIA